MLIDGLFPYQAQDSESGIVMELYLPKKSYFQGTLYDTLTKGFDISHVKNHLLDKTKRESIRNLLSNYAIPIISKGLDDSRINKIERIFWGYSMYEVDGVFSNFKNGKINTVEERTQIIRMMFLPDIEVLKARLEENQLEESDTNLNHFVQQVFLADEVEARKLSVEIKSFPIIKKYLEDLIWDITLFLFGYIVYEICDKIQNLSESGDITPEDEIWVTSFWNLQVNRIKILKQAFHSIQTNLSVASST
jgi:hypothetical protein